MNLPFDPIIPLLGIHPKDSSYKRDTCITIFTDAFFKVAKSWKLPRYPSVDKWIMKMWYIYTMEFYAVVKKDEICRQMDGTWTCYAKWGNTVSENQTTHVIPHLWFLTPNPYMEVKVSNWSVKIISHWLLLFEVYVSIFLSSKIYEKE